MLALASGSWSRDRPIANPKWYSSHPVQLHDRARCSLPWSGWEINMLQITLRIYCKVSLGLDLQELLVAAQHRHPRESFVPFSFSCTHPGLVNESDSGNTQFHYLTAKRLWNVTRCGVAQCQQALMLLIIYSRERKGEISCWLQLK